MNSYDLNLRQQFAKRTFDIVSSLFGITICSPLILIGYVYASYDTKSSGLFVQVRIGQNGKEFKVYKLKTMVNKQVLSTTVTQENDPRITSSGLWLRKYKIDELPQLFNVLIGNMSLVGPRPDVPGFADKLKGNDRAILSIRPGITGPASIKYKNEEKILSNQMDAEAYNRDVIFPDKVNINLNYIKNWSIQSDVMYIIKTIR